ncbi:MAG TPA: M15 family metallopeptidase [Chitinophagales bacterium]|nr:M15 family metallopeptidase [Chitinophagales bacterium]
MNFAAKVRVQLQKKEKNHLFLPRFRHLSAHGGIQVSGWAVYPIFEGKMKLFAYLVAMAMLAGCSVHDSEPKSAVPAPPLPHSQAPLAARMKTAGLVNVQEHIPDILVELKYSTTDNFVKTDVYGDLDSAYLQPDVVNMLEKAYTHLQTLDSSLTFIVYDATRPLSVQQYMWDILQIPIEEKGKYLSNPDKGSIHNYGAAIDISLAVKTTGKALDMGTTYDFFGPEAEPIQEAIMLANGKLTQQQHQNRLTLRKAMESAGFRQLPTEWWHYNACSREEAKKRYDVVE